jgi:hypothetical protein
MWAFVAVFFVALLVDVGIDSLYFQNKPLAPNVAQSQVIELTVMHGSKRYVNEAELRLYNNTQRCAGVTMLVSFGILGLIKGFLPRNNSPFARSS